MITKIYTVFDSKMATYSPPFMKDRDAAAIRDFSDWVNDGRDERNMLFKHPEDFSLFTIGEFDSLSGFITPITPLSLVTASALRSALPEKPVNDFQHELNFNGRKEIVA